MSLQRMLAHVSYACTAFAAGGVLPAVTTAQRHELQQVILEHLAAEGRPEDIPGLQLKTVAAPIAETCLRSACHFLLPRKPMHR